MATAKDIHKAGVAGDLPAAAAHLAGILYHATDTGELWRCDDDGNDWTVVANNYIAPESSEQLVTFTFGVNGTLTTGAKPVRVHSPAALTISGVTATVNTAPTNGSVIIDVHKNGTTIFTTQGNRPEITAGNNDDLSSTPDVTTLALNDVLTVEVDGVGGTIAGADLVVQVRCSS